MNTQQKKLMALAAVVLFHGAVITVMLAQHGCKSDASKPSAEEAPAPVAPAAVAPTPAPVAASDGFVEPTRPPPETPVTPVPVAQYSEPLPQLAPPPVEPVAAAPASAPTPAPSPMSITYVVQPRETLTSIARKNKITVDELVAANAPKVTRTSILLPGESLNIPNPAPASAAPAATAAPADTANMYKVVSGDNLTKIAIKNHTTVKAIEELNGLKSQSIRAGQLLKLPDASASAPTASAPEAGSAASTAAPASEGSTYVVKSGDTLDGIAHATHVTVAELMSLNNLTNATARNIRPGQVLKLPSGASAPEAPAPTAPPPTVPVSAAPVSTAPPPVTMPVMAVPGNGTSAPPVTPVQ
jgi:LysM repeat protein